tara:strand:- start:416 stop:1387 length:972 start_codon:yes stop_codon:yes gene_type:complete
MEENSSKKYFESNMKVIEFAKHYWKFLLGIAVVSGVLAVFFSEPNFIAPKFTSTAIIYPANLGGYSGETRLDQMQQYLESNEIRDTIINKYNLYDEYEVDSSKLYHKSLMINAFSKHFTFEETRYESIKITVTSKSPIKAKQMADEVLKQLDLTIRTTEREKFKELLVIYENLMLEKKNQVDSLEKQIRKISTEYGILDYIAQSEEVTKGYMQFLLSGKKGSDFQEAKELYNNLEQYGRHYHNLHAQLNEINDEYVRRLHEYEQILKDYNKEQTYSYVLVKPEVPDKKSSPVRVAIVLAAIAASVGFTFVMMLLLGYQRKKNV